MGKNGSGTGRPPRWTDEEDARLLSLREQDPPGRWEDISEKMDRPASGCKTRYYDLKGGILRKPNGKREVAGDDENNLDPFEILRSPVDWRTRLAAAEEQQRIVVADNITEKIAERTIITEKPFALWFTSDWHLGSIGTNMKVWREHIEQFFEIRNLSMFLVGDMIANIAIHKFVLPVFQQTMGPEQQGQMIGSILFELVQKKKIEAVVFTEEHDQRDSRHTGVSFLREILRPMKTKIAFLDNRGQVLLHIGPSRDKLITYVIHAVHKTRYNSFMNALHGAIREAHLSIAANVIVTAHTHRPAMGWFNVQQDAHDVLQKARSPIVLGDEIFAIRCGTYEQDSQYGWQGYGPLPEPKVQVLVFDPHHRHIEMAKSFDASRKLCS